MLQRNRERERERERESSIIYKSGKQKPVKLKKKTKKTSFPSQTHQIHLRALLPRRRRPRPLHRLEAGPQGRGEGGGLGPFEHLDEEGAPCSQDSSSSSSFGRRRRRRSSADPVFPLLLAPSSSEREPCCGPRKGQRARRVGGADPEGRVAEVAEDDAETLCRCPRRRRRRRGGGLRYDVFFRRPLELLRLLSLHRVPEERGERPRRQIEDVGHAGEDGSSGPNCRRRRRSSPSLPLPPQAFNVDLDQVDPEDDPLFADGLGSHLQKGPGGAPQVEDRGPSRQQPRVGAREGEELERGAGWVAEEGSRGGRGIGPFRHFFFE